MKSYQFPFSAILGQDRMKLALILNVIDPKIGGVLLTGHQGTGKSTAVRSLTKILPKIPVNKGCRFHCHLDEPENYCEWCHTHIQEPVHQSINIVNLPLGSTQEMVIGSLDLEKIIREGKKAIQPGLLAKAHRGILYIDEINLLQDHLVDILLDVSASGVNIVEREGISLTHPSQFILIGSMNPEEGELRPQISDRLGLEVQILAPTDPNVRAEISRRVVAFYDNPDKFIKKFDEEQKNLQEQIIKAQNLVSSIQIPESIFLKTADLILKLGLYSLRADITFIRCTRALAAFNKHQEILYEDLQQAVDLVFLHRISHLVENLDPVFLNEKFQEVFSDSAEKYSH